MKLDASIKVFGDEDKIMDCFKPELSDKKRSNFSISKKEGYVLFKIDADDSVALRATLNGITKLLTVYEKMEGL